MIYLNDFRPEVVKEVLSQITDKDLVYWGGVGQPWPEWKYVILAYEPMFHRIHIEEFENPLWPNPDAVGIMVPEKKFLKSIVPSEEYYKMMNS